MEEKLKELELQLNYVSYNAEMSEKLSKVWKAFFELKECIELASQPSTKEPDNDKE